MAVPSSAAVQAGPVMRISTGRGSPWDDTPAEASTPASTTASACAPAGSQDETGFATASATISGPVPGSAVEDCGAPSSSKVSIMRVRIGAAGCGCPPWGATAWPRNQGSSAGALPCAAPGAAG